ncbi:MAG: hypothetical protein ACTSVI_13465 [Promethearchaeota archaeon]
MAFRWIISRIVRLFAQKTNSLFYILTYREIQSEIAEIAEKIGVKPSDLSKEIGMRAAKESAERHASVLGLVPINPNNPKKIVQYIETLWFILFGRKLKDYEIKAEVLADGRQKVTFYIKNCPVCMGHEEDRKEYQEFFDAFTGEGSEGYACMMAGMLEQLATIIMENKNMDIRMDIKETSCYVRGDDIMAVEAIVVPKEQYYEKQPISLTIPVEKQVMIEGERMGAVEQLTDQSTKMFEQIANALHLEQIDEFFESPLDAIKEKIEELIEKQLQFKPREILEYFKNYEEDIFRVVGYLFIHLLNEAGDLISQLSKNYLMNRLLDIIFSALEYGLETYLPEIIVKDNKNLISRFIEGWVDDESLEAFKQMDSKKIYSLTLEGMKLAFLDYGAQFIGVKGATFDMLRKISIVSGEEPSNAFNIVFDIFQETALIAGYIFAIPIRLLLSGTYETIRSPVTSIQEIYQASREHLEKLFDLIEQAQEIDFNVQDNELGENFSRSFPRIF